MSVCKRCEGGGFIYEGTYEEGPCPDCFSTGTRLSVFAVTSIVFWTFAILMLDYYGYLWRVVCGKIR